MQQIEKLGHDRRTEAGAKLSEDADPHCRYESSRSSPTKASCHASSCVRRPMAPSCGLNVNTVGAVISPGQALMELLPKNAELVVEAKLQFTDIDAVHVGREAHVRLAALNQRTTPVVPSHVVFVSADKLMDRQNPNHAALLSRSVAARSRQADRRAIAPCWRRACRLKHSLQHQSAP